MSKSWCRDEIMNALDELLQRQGVPYQGVGARQAKPKGPLIGMVYLEQNPDDLPPDIRAKIPDTIRVARGLRAWNVRVQPKDVRLELQ